MKAPFWAASIVVIAVVGVLIGCVPDDAPGSLGETAGETGGPDGGEEIDGQDAIPVDPLAGELSWGCEPQDDIPWEAWTPPSSLGNGLVHDSRLALSGGKYTYTKSTAALGHGIDHSKFVDSYEAMTQVGFRPAQLRVEVAAESLGSGSTKVKVTDRSVYISDDDANFRTEVQTYLFGDVDAEKAKVSYTMAQQGARPVAIDTFAVDAGNTAMVGFSLAWVHANDNLHWALRLVMSKPDMASEIDELADQGYRPISLASRERAGKREYAAVFVNDGMPAEHWSVSLGLAADDLADELQSASESGWYPFRISGEQGSWARVNVVWTRRPPGLNVAIRLNLNTETFEVEDATMRSQGFHLETLDRYDDGGARLVGVWLRYEPCLRWTGTENSPDEPDNLTKYAMFHDQALAAMTFIGTPLEGRMLRPSGTLHVFAGAELAFNRAYTFAPAIYPETPLHAPMLLASASKSITAAAVVMEMAKQGLPLTTPFVIAAGIPGAPASMATVTVLEVLRNLGGFRAEDEVAASLAGSPLSYSDHGVVDASPYGTLPIDGSEMFNYVVEGGHLDTNDNDSYWDLARYDDSKTNATLHYSNPGYSMLGELVARLSDSPYEQYVIDNLAEPLNLQDKIFADPGHRKDASGPTLAGKRCYLINADHPYRSIAEGEQDPEQAPLFGMEPLPTIVGDSSTRWRINTGPVDPAAPEYASASRYAGKLYLGGAPLAAGGWWADGATLGALIRSLAQTDYLMADAVAAQLWDPQWKNDNGARAPGWSYALGWYIRGNWVAWAGGTAGSMATILHNRRYDFTVVYLTNVAGNGLQDFMNPLMDSPQSLWGQSKIGAIFPCGDDPETPQDECPANPGAAAY